MKAAGTWILRGLAVFCAVVFAGLLLDGFWSSPFSFCIIWRWVALCCALPCIAAWWLIREGRWLRGGGDGGGTAFAVAGAALLPRRVESIARGRTMSMRLRRPARGLRKIFQPLEKNFPIIGKTGANFPTIGKIFSNHWKKPEKFFQSLENRRKIFPIVGKLAALLLLLAAPSARAEDTVWMPDPAAVVRYTRTGPWDRTEREVPKAEGDGIIELLRGWESFEDCRPSPQEERAKWIVRPWLPAPNLVLTAFSENGLIGHIEFHKRTDCATGGTRLEVALPGVRKHVPGEAADMLLSLFDAWNAADLKAFRDAEPFPRRYVLESNRHDGGTLSGTAKLFYGDGNLWRIIWGANRASVPDPDRPIPGTELVIPAPPERKPAGIWEGRIHDDIRDWPLPCQYVLGMDPRDGGTLSGVARLFYGDGGKWPVIWDANKDAVPDPDRPKPGTSLKIPALAEGAAQ